MCGPSSERIELGLCDPFLRRGSGWDIIKGPAGRVGADALVPDPQFGGSGFKEDGL